jgi:hypothetical protein
MVTRIKDLVRNEGEITTIEKLDARGLIEYHEAKNFLNRGKVTTKYFDKMLGLITVGMVIWTAIGLWIYRDILDIFRGEE